MLCPGGSYRADENRYFIFSFHCLFELAFGAVRQFFRQQERLYFWKGIVTLFSQQILSDQTSCHISTPSYFGHSCSSLSLWVVIHNSFWYFTNTHSDHMPRWIADSGSYTVQTLNHYFPALIYCHTSCLMSVSPMILAWIVYVFFLLAIRYC